MSIHKLCLYRMYSLLIIVVILNTLSYTLVAVNGSSLNSINTYYLEFIDSDKASMIIDKLNNVLGLSKESKIYTKIEDNYLYYIVSANDIRVTYKIKKVGFITITTNIKSHGLKISIDSAKEKALEIVNVASSIVLEDDISIEYKLANISYMERIGYSSGNKSFREILGVELEYDIYIDNIKLLQKSYIRLTGYGEVVKAVLFIPVVRRVESLEIITSDKALSNAREYSVNTGLYYLVVDPNVLDNSTRNYYKILNEPVIIPVYYLVKTIDSNIVKACTYIALKEYHGILFVYSGSPMGKLTMTTTVETTELQEILYTEITNTVETTSIANSLSNHEESIDNNYLNNYLVALIVLVIIIAMILITKYK